MPNRAVKTCAFEIIERIGTESKPKRAPRSTDKTCTMTKHDCVFWSFSSPTDAAWLVFQDKTRFVEYFTGLVSFRKVYGPKL